MDSIFISDFFDDPTENKEILYIKDSERRYVYISRFFFEMMEYLYGMKLKEEEVLGKKSHEFLSKRTADFFYELDKDVIEKKAQINRFTSFKFKLHTIIAIASEKPYFNEDKLIRLKAVVRYLNFFYIDKEIVILSPRELDILVHMAFGLRLKTAAANLNISIGTVASTMDSVKKKLNITNQKSLLTLLKSHSLSRHILDYYFEILSK